VAPTPRQSQSAWKPRLRLARPMAVPHDASHLAEDPAVSDGGFEGSVIGHLRSHSDVNELLQSLVALRDDDYWDPSGCK